MGKYSLDMTISYTYPRQKSPSDHPYPLVGVDLPLTHMGMGHSSGHLYRQRLNIYQNNTLYKHQIYTSKYHYKILASFNYPFNITQDNWIK
jgi:hypothetical protein